MFRWLEHWLKILLSLLLVISGFFVVQYYDSPDRTTGAGVNVNDLPMIWRFNNNLEEDNNRCDLSETAGTGDFTDSYLVEGNYSFQFGSSKLDNLTCDYVTSAKNMCLMYWWNSSTSGWQNIVDLGHYEYAWSGNYWRLAVGSYLDSGWGWSPNDGDWHQVVLSLRQWNSTNFEWCHMQDNKTNVFCANKTYYQSSNDGVQVGHWWNGGDYASGQVDYIVLYNNTYCDDSIISDHYAKDIWANTTTPSSGDPINITVTSTIDKVSLADNPLTVSFTTNDTITAAYYTVDEESITSISDLTSPHSFVLPFLSLGKNHPLNLTVTYNGKNYTDNSTIKYFIPELSSLSSSYSPRIFYNTSTLASKKTRYSELNPNSGSPWPYPADKIVWHLDAKTAYTPTLSYGYDTNSIGNLDDRGYDLQYSSMLCKLDGNNTLGFNSVYGSPTYACDLALNALYNLAVFNNQLQAWFSYWDWFGRATPKYAVAYDMMAENLTTAQRDYVEDVFLNWSASVIWRLKQEDSSSTEPLGSSANLEVNNRIMSAMGVASMAMSVRDLDIDEDYTFCTRYFGTSGQCDGTLYNISDLYPSVSNVTWQNLFNDSFDAVFGVTLNSTDVSRFPDVYDGYVKTFLGDYDEGIPQQGDTYANHIHTAMDDAFLIGYYAFNNSGVEWNLFSMFENYFKTPTEFYYRVNNYPVPWGISTGNDYWSVLQWANGGLFNAYLDGNVTLQDKYLYYMRSKYSDTSYLSRVVNNDKGMSYWIYEPEGFETLWNSSTAEDNRSALCDGLSKTNVFDDDAWAFLKGGCGVNDTTIMLHGGGTWQQFGAHYNDQCSIFEETKNKFLEVPAGSPKDEYNENDDTAVYPALGINITDTAQFNQKGHYTQADFGWANYYSNQLLVDGHGPRSSEVVHTYPQPDACSIDDARLLNDNIGVVSMSGVMNGTDITSVDSGGVSQKRTVISLYNYDLSFEIDSFSDVASSHVYSRKSLIGENNDSVITYSSSLDTSTVCYSTSCLDSWYSGDVSFLSYPAVVSPDDLGTWDDYLDILLVNYTTDDLLVVKDSRWSGDSKSSVADASVGDYLSFQVTKGVNLIDVNFTKSTGVWKVRAWTVSTKAFIEKATYDGSTIVYSTNGVGETYPDAPASNSCDFSSSCGPVDCSERCTISSQGVCSDTDTLKLYGDGKVTLDIFIDVDDLLVTGTCVLAGSGGVK